MIAGAAMALWNTSHRALARSWPRSACGSPFSGLPSPKRTGERLKSFLAALAAASLLLLADARAVDMARPSSRCAQRRAPCRLHGRGVVLSFRGARDHRRPEILLGALAGIGVAAIAAMFVVDPHFLQGLFSSLDPLVAREWYQASTRACGVSAACGRRRRRGLRAAARRIDRRVGCDPQDAGHSAQGLDRVRLFARAVTVAVFVIRGWDRHCQPARHRLPSRPRAAPRPGLRGAGARPRDPRRCSSWRPLMPRRARHARRPAAKCGARV